MSKYELTVVFPEKSKSKEKSLKEKVEKNIEDLKGKVEKADSWGTIELSYSIKKEKVGLFLHFLLEISGTEIKKLNDKLRVDDNIIRYLLIKKD